MQRTVCTALCLIMAPSVYAQVQSVAPTQDATAPPASAHAVLTLHAVGSQIYTCQPVGQAANRGFHWIFFAPAARLFDSAGNEVATHGDGPVWNYQDGSSVGGVVQATTASPDRGSIPWLLLKAVHPQRTGILSTVDFIRRSETQGGTAPATSCDATHQGDFTRVPYTATYTFYSARP
ncbi:MAG: DUF3455 domain-containing protein [Acidobacteriota bacterium]|nr:DUF3455 domain-containing protein [Acidobacteriota bacterium]